MEPSQLKQRAGINLRACGETLTVPPPEDAAICWICLDVARAGNPLVQPCACPRHVHASCLARWQLQSAGSRREVACEFCDRQLPDWKKTLTPVYGASAPAVMNVNFDGRTYSFEVHPGPDGYQQFTAAIRRAFCLPDDSELNITFTCDEPTAVDPLTAAITPAMAAAAAAAAAATGQQVDPRPPSSPPNLSPLQLPPLQLPLQPTLPPTHGPDQPAALQDSMADSQPPRLQQQAQQPQQSQQLRPTLSAAEQSSPVVPPQAPPAQPPPLPALAPLPLPESVLQPTAVWAPVVEGAAAPGALLTLQGAGAYDAAVHCASVSAARRLIQQQQLAGLLPALQAAALNRADTAEPMEFSPLAAGLTPEGDISAGGGFSAAAGAAPGDPSSSGGSDSARRKRIPAAFTRKLRSLCDMLSLGK